MVPNSGFCSSLCHSPEQGENFSSYGTNDLIPILWQHVMNTLMFNHSQLHSIE
jgi:hypothetical protein